MKRWLKFSTWALLTLAGSWACLAVEAAPPTPAKGGWTPLFNGNDLAGWEVYPGGTGKWKVRDGLLTGGGGTYREEDKGGFPVSLRHSSYLFTKRDWTNFRLRVEVRINEKGASGLYFRTPFGSEVSKGYMAGLETSHDLPLLTLAGSLFGWGPGKGERFINKQVERALVKPNAWFTEEVVADGNRLTVKVNGHTTAEYVDRRGTYTKGRIALEHGSPETVIQFRKIEILDLPASR